jgi:hypothetical protein
MTAGKRTSISASHRVEVCCRWKAGKSLHATLLKLMVELPGSTATVSDRTHTSGTGSSRGIACGFSRRAIAKGLQRSVLTVTSVSSQWRPITRPGSLLYGPRSVF